MAPVIAALAETFTAFGAAFGIEVSASTAALLATTTLGPGTGLALGGVTRKVTMQARD